ncbi:patched family-domain-containing protein [Fimicolochytrium jonesii]|uniref:patched family-domain-containing protein n=1 Tax=Fimicolochytrium jonesii TaxID=1396493 RepID=UPI0022FEF035|nr:patched family-domain-containing protein [Fimicolochytrium jonesii]KAI8816904.1 patched family-domain-containing protein [Fimicolochytrium jonesii]
MGQYLVNLHTAIRRHVDSGADALAHNVSTNPKRCITIALLCSLVPCLGLFQVHWESDPVKLLSAAGSAVQMEQQKVEASFGKGGGVSLILRPTVPGTSVIQHKFLLALFDLQETIMGIKVNAGGGTGMKGLDDICVKVLTSGGEVGCFIQSPVQDVWATRHDLLTDQHIHRTLSFQHTSYCKSSSAASGSTIGDLEWTTHSPRLVSRGTSLKLSIPFFTAVDDANADRLTRAFEREFVRIVTEANERGSDETYGRPGFQLTYITTNSITDELSQTVAETAFLFLGGFIIMFAYTSLALGDFHFDRVRSRAGLALFALANSCVAMAGGVGMASVFGVPVHPLTLQIMPFFVFGVGLDNVFLLKRGFADRSRELPAADRMAATMHSVGYALFTATIEMTLGLFLCCILPMRLITSMCIMCALAIALNMFLMLTSVSSALVLDEQRIREGRNDLFCSFLPNNTARHGHAHAGTEASLTWLDRKLGNFYDALIGTSLGKRLTIGTFAAFALLAPLGMAYIQRDMFVLDFVNSKGAVAGYLAQNMQEYPSSETFTIVFTTPNQLSAPTQHSLLSLHQALQTLPYVDPGSHLWLADFKLWLTAASPHKSEIPPAADIIPPEKAGEWLALFLNDTTYGGICHRANIKVDDEGQVVASRMFVDYKYRKTVYEYTPAVVGVRGVLNSAGVEAATFGRVDIVARVFEALTAEAASGLLLFIGGAVLVNLSLFANARSTFLSVPIMLATVITVFASLPVLNIQLNPLIIANALISMSIANDFLGYIQKAYIESLSTSEAYTLLFHETVSHSTNKVKTSKWCTATLVSLTYALVGALLSVLLLALSPMPMVSKVFFRMFLGSIGSVWVFCLGVYPNLLVWYGQGSGRKGWGGNREGAGMQSLRQSSLEMEE